MSAEDHLQPRQFGPGGKYTTRTGDYPGQRRNYVEAVHTNSGRTIGAMNWFGAPSAKVSDQAPRLTSKAGYEVDPNKPTIFKVVVSANMRRKGIATAMLNHARDIEPDLQHSHALSEDGAEWAKRRP